MSSEFQVTEDKQALRVALLNSDVIIYDTLSCLEEAAWAIEGRNLSYNMKCTRSS
jgi:hypothetical protein